ncbi:MAG: dihydropteroate synthase [Micrococcales bacterium 73-13]|nr:MAG: dihydropteroate synthase [Micrococcales bacterium 73-13]
MTPPTASSGRRGAGPAIFGVLNVTPDSFSDGGDHYAPEAAIEHGLSLVADGADWIDVGGESTAPASEPIAPEEERRRVLPVVAALADRGVPVSIDTYHASTAEAAVEAGATIVNDVFGSDPGMAGVLRRTGARYVTMHSFGAPTTPHRYGDVVEEVRSELLRRAAALQAEGVEPERIILDPGLGFSKEPEENWALLRGAHALAATGYPVLIGVSRKRFVRRLLAESSPAGASGEDVPMADRDLATAVTSALAALAGAWAVRVHDVRATRIALDVAGAWRGVPG